MGSIAWIAIAPVKGLALLHPEQVRLDSVGVAENRRFYLVDERGELVNGKRLGPLVRIVPRYDGAVDVLALLLPDGDEVAGEIALGRPVVTSFYGRPVSGRVVEGPWSEALTALAGRQLVLVRTDDPGAGSDRGSRGGVSLVSTASLDALARAGGSDGRVDGRRFRMLFGVDGTSAHEEDEWIGRRVSVGEAVVLLRGNVGRCAVTTQNPDTGRPDFDTLRVLSGYRGDLATTEPLPFGVWGEVAEPGTVRLGDSVTPAG